MFIPFLVVPAFLSPFVIVLWFVLSTREKTIKTLKRLIAEKVATDGLYKGQVMQARSMLKGDIPDLIAIEFASLQINKVVGDLKGVQKRFATGYLEADSINDRWVFVRSVFGE